MDFKIRSALPWLALSAGLALTGCSDDEPLAQVEAKMVLDPQVVEFGDVQVGTTVTKTVFIKNTGSGVLSVGSVSPGQPYDEAFEFDTEAPIDVVPAGTAFLEVRFSPLEEGDYNAVLVVRSPDPKVGEQQLTLTGAGVTTILQVEPDELSFGNVVVNTTKTLPITLTNNSDVDGQIEYLAGQNVRSCSSSGQDPARFCVLLRDRQIGPDGRFTLRAGETTTLEVQFTPNIAGPRERGDFLLRACDVATEACETTIRLDGLGIESGFRCDPPSMDFGQVNPGSCLTRSVSCENIANEQITVVDWTTTQQSSPDFETSQPTVQVLVEGESVDVDVTYCPDSLGEDSGDLQIETDNPDVRLRTVLVPLEGTGGGPDIDVLPTTLNFGLVSLIAPSRRTVTIQNVGFAPLDIAEIVVDGAGTGAFISPDAAGARLEQGEFLDVTVEFQPITEGPVESTLLIRSNDQDEPEVTVTLVGEGVSLPPCSFELNPEALSFGVVERGRTVSRAIEIRNIGQDDCLVTGVRLVPGSDGAFSLPDGDVRSVIIAPGASKTIRVEFTPQIVGTFMGQIEVSISSPSSPYNLIPLSGTGADATLLIVPRDLDFGTIGVGCNARTRTVTIYNTGSTNARIDSIAVAGTDSAFRLAGLPGLPLDLAPGESATFDVGFFAAATSSYADAVEITGEYGGQPVTYIVGLQGAGDVNATQSDDFEQLGKPKVDILFSIDDSCSMDTHQAALGNNFQSFIQFANAQALDYQIGVTSMTISGSGAHGTAEAGRLVHRGPGGDSFAGPASNKIVTPDTMPSAEAVFVANVIAGDTSGGAAQDESGFEAAYLALSNPLIFGHNAGFLRQDAVLSVIFVTDAGEQSPQPVDFYANFFKSIKGFRNTNLFTASAISPPAPGDPSCTLDPFTEPTRYIQMAALTGGIHQSICISDWSRALEDLSTTAFGFKSRFFLTNQPVEDTVTVYVDDVALPPIGARGTVNWTYDYTTNSVNFSPFAVPEPGAQIRVDYTVQCL